MNQLFLYTEGRSGKLDANKGLLLRGDIGTGKSTIMQILNRYSYFTRGKARGGYPVGGFRVDSTSGIANSFSMRGNVKLTFSAILQGIHSFHFHYSNSMSIHLK